MLQHFGQKLRNNSGFAATLLDVYILLNLGFLALDVFIAHSVNAFAHRVEWIPFYFSLAAPGVLALTIFTEKHNLRKFCRLGIAGCAICLGIAGMLFHLSSGFFADLTLKNLVYTAPFVAPLAYTGLGMLLVTNQMIPDADRQWAQWVVFLAGCGWCGNFLLSALDHAQNGFFDATEWIPVITSALAVGYFITLYCQPDQAGLSKYSIAVFGVNFLVGIAGFFLHLLADLHLPSAEDTEKFLYGAPVFAPLLFSDLSVLALLGLSKWR